MHRRDARRAAGVDRLLWATLLLPIGGLLLAWATGWQLDREAYTTLQHPWFVGMNRALNSWPAAIWTNLTMLGDASVLIPLLSPLLLWRAQAWAAVLAAVPVASIISVTLKHLASVPRPAALLDHQTFTILGDTLSAKTSFPSGHSLTIFTGLIAVLITLAPRPLNRRYLAMLLAALSLAILVGLSRVAVGAHWPLDVVAGAFCGLVAGINGAAIAQRYQQWWRYPLQSSGCCLIGILLAWASLSLLHRTLDEPAAGLILGESGLIGALVSLWLLQRCLTRVLAGKKAQTPDSCNDEA